VNALDDLDAGLVHQGIEDRIIAGRRIEEHVFDAGGLELSHEQRAARALHLPHCRGRRRRGRSERLRHRPYCPGAHAERAQAGHQLAARHPVVEILLDQLLHGILLRSALVSSGVD